MLMCTLSHVACVSPEQEVDDFAVAQRTPLPEFIAGHEGDEVKSRVRFHTATPTQFTRPR